MRGSEFAELQIFATVARMRSFVRAAEVLDMSSSSVSQVLRELEARLGLRLLNRTTRSVSPTNAGSRLLERLQPLLGEFDKVLTELDDLRCTPVGTVKMSIPRIAYVDLLEPLLGGFHASYPNVVLDVAIDDGLSDLIAKGFDIGVRLGEFLEDSVVAYPLGPSLRQIPVASPAYLAAYGTPSHPRELRTHHCINWRQHGKTSLYEWEFARGEEKLSIAVKGPLIVNDRSLTVAAAMQGVGITMWAEHRLRPYIDSGALVPFLEEWCPSFPGFFAYVHKQRHMPLALRAVLDFLQGRN